MDPRIRETQAALAVAPGDAATRERLARELERGGLALEGARVRAEGGDPARVVAYLTALAPNERGEALDVFGQFVPELARAYLALPPTDAARAKARKALVNRLYASRKVREGGAVGSHPEGRTLKGKCWYPSVREDCDGSGSQVRAPSHAWPHSYRDRCRTKHHCANLIAAALEGRNVPTDAMRVAGAAALLYWKGATAGHWRVHPSPRPAAVLPEPFEGMACGNGLLVGAWEVVCLARSKRALAAEGSS